MPPTDLGTYALPTTTIVDVCGTNANKFTNGAYYDSTNNRNVGWLYTPKFGIRNVETFMPNLPAGTKIGSVDGLNGSGWISGTWQDGSGNSGVYAASPSQ